MITTQSKGCRLAKSNPWPTVLACLILLAALSLAFGLGAMLATAGREDGPPQEATVPATSNEPSAAPAETPEPVRHRDDIVSEGRLLAYDLQETMGSDISDIAGNTGSMAKSLEVSGEELEYLRDIAERDAINRFTTAEVKIDMTGMTNKIDGGADLNGVIRELTDGFTEALVTAAEGVHA